METHLNYSTRSFVDGINNFWIFISHNASFLTVHRLENQKELVEIIWSNSQDQDWIWYGSSPVKVFLSQPMSFLPLTLMILSPIPPGESEWASMYGLVARWSWTKIEIYGPECRHKKWKLFSWELIEIQQNELEKFLSLRRILLL